VNRLFLSVGLAVACTLLAFPRTCAAAATGGSKNVDVVLVAEGASIRPGEPFHVGLHMKMKRGWHTYWKQPGDAGLPLGIDWALPPGFTAGPIEWPTPERIETGDLMSYGYERDVLLAVRITPSANIEPGSVTIAGNFDWLECKDVCLAGSARLELTLPVRPERARPGPAARLFSDARARSPRHPEGWSLASVAGPRAIELSFRPPIGVSPQGGYFFADQPLVAEHAAPQGFERVPGGFRLTIVPAENAASPPQRLTGVLVLEGIPRSKGNALAVNVDATPGDPVPAPAQSRHTLPATPLYAILTALVALALVILLRRRAQRS
jgi:thiol:disulfide interchange protein DsbD